MSPELKSSIYHSQHVKKLVHSGSQSPHILNQRLRARTKHAPEYNPHHLVPPVCATSWSINLPDGRVASLVVEDVLHLGRSYPSGGRARLHAIAQVVQEAH